MDKSIHPEPVPKSITFLNFLSKIKLLAISTISSDSGLGSRTSVEIRNVEE